MGLPWGVMYIIITWIIFTLELKAILGYWEFDRSKLVSIVPFYMQIYHFIRIETTKTQPILQIWKLGSSEDHITAEYVVALRIMNDKGQQITHQQILELAVKLAKGHFKLYVCDSSLHLPLVFCLRWTSSSCRQWRSVSWPFSTGRRRLWLMKLSATLWGATMRQDEFTSHLKSSFSLWASCVLGDPWGNSEALQRFTCLQTLHHDGLSPTWEECFKTEPTCYTDIHSI